MHRVLPLVALPLLASFAPANRPAGKEGAVIVGPSVLMNARAHDEAAVYDLRPTGRPVPGAQPSARFSSAEKRAIFLLGETKVCARFASIHNLNSYYVVPPRMMEFEPIKAVPQISPREAKAKVERQNWPLFDISEAEEFAASRLPHSQRLGYAGFQNSELPPRGRPFIVACRVGHRSQLVVQRLREMGYDARNLNGGLWAWECAGLPLESKR